jgi:hypothetical protein
MAVLFAHTGISVATISSRKRGAPRAGVVRIVVP